MSEEMIEKIDENNMKALAVLDNMLAVFAYDPGFKYGCSASVGSCSWTDK